MLLVGDPDQLPPVGPGNVFSDLIRSGMVQTVRLTQIFRQAQKSLIVMNAHAVNQGELPRLTATDRDFFFLRRRDPAAAVRTIQELCQTRLPKNMGIAPADIQVLSPSRKHETGTKALNLALQAVLNPPADGKKEKKHGDFSFRIGDRVMQIRNNYDIMWKRASAEDFFDLSVIIAFSRNMPSQAFSGLTRLFFYPLPGVPVYRYSPAVTAVLRTVAHKAGIVAREFNNHETLTFVQRHEFFNQVGRAVDQPLHRGIQIVANALSRQQGGILEIFQLTLCRGVALASLAGQRHVILPRRRGRLLGLGEKLGSVGVEKTWPLHSPNVEKVEVVRKGKVRRAKLYYLRDRIGKAAKVKELVK